MKGTTILTTIPFENSNDDISGNRESGGEENENPGDGMVGGKPDVASPSSSSALFPPWLSSWMTSPSRHDPPAQQDDDDSLYHDCLSKDDIMNGSSSSSSSLEDETTRLLALTAHHYDSPQRPNRDVNVDQNDLSQSLTSPLAQALATWLSPYAESAKRAGKKVLFFSEEPSTGQESDPVADENSSLLGGNETGERTATTVRFWADYESTENRGETPRSKRDARLLNRSESSPALMTMFPDERRTNAGERGATNADSAIVLRDIDVQGDGNPSEDGMVIYPWTKLIVLEELGTAWSWFVLLLPYAFLILAVILDGDTTFKNTMVGPLLGNTSCAEMIQGSVPTPFDESVKGYFPVPFPIGPNRTEEFSGPCSYPFELRDGVGLLSHGNKFSGLDLASPPATEKTSIVDAHYRYYMSHGYAFTSGVLANVPPTSQSLSGSVTFTNLSSSAVALVARGSVLVSAVVFQRRPPGEGGPSQTQWSPVLILSSKRLDMVCKLNGGPNGTDNEESTWNCSSRRVLNAYFSLPNTAVLTGEALRVDILFSHHKVYKSLEEDLWINERGGGFMSADDDYVIHDLNNNFVLSEAEMILSEADVSHHQELLAELSTKSASVLQHESVLFYNVVEGTRIFSLTITMMFLCYWLWSMGKTDGVTDSGTETPPPGTENDDNQMSSIWSLLLRCCRRNSRHKSHFWWEDPWTFFPERRYLLLLLCCLVTLQNPLLVYAFFHPSLYSSAKFRFAADSSSGICVHGILFLWLCLVHGLRYYTADIARRRLSQHRRVLELRTCIDNAMDHRHVSPTHQIEDNQWGGVWWYHQQYGDVDGTGTVNSMALRLKHDINSDSFVEFIFPKATLLVIGIVSSITAAASRFPESPAMAEVEPNLDQMGSASKLYVVSSIVQLVIFPIWCILIVYTSFITGKRLRREPFLSTRPSQLAFRVLSSILLLGVGFSISLFYFHSLNFLGKYSTSDNILPGNEVSYDTSIGGNDESWGTRADVLFGIIRNTSAALPYVGTASSIGPGKILYATACSLVVAFVFLPSSHFHPSMKDQRKVDEITINPDQSLSNLDKRVQGKDKRFVVALARNTHTWRVFPLPTRSHGLLSQHTLKETLRILGTFQLDGQFKSHKLKFGRGAIYKGRYTPIFCVEIGCWLLEASWQAYYSPVEYSLNEWAPGRMRLDSIGLKLERAVDNNETDTHAFVASNILEQVEGEEDSIIVVSFRGSASMSNVKTDLSFRQVPLPEDIMSDVPAFNIRPGMPIVVDETLWNESSSQAMHDIRRHSFGNYAPWPTAAAEGSSTNDQVVPDQSQLIPAVSSGAKAILRATPVARQALPMVHDGFLQSYLSVRKEIIEAVVTAYKRQLDKSIDRSRHDAVQPLTLPKIYCTGHSMGGCFAQLLALDLASNCEIVIEQPACEGEVASRQSQSSLNIEDEEANESLDNRNEYWLGQKLAHKSTPAKKIRLRPPIGVYTYGQSRLGNLAFKTIYKNRVPHTFRVATEGDAVTAIPTVGPLCGGVYRHAGLEVLLEEGCTGNILVGPTVVETLLRFTKVRTSMAAHAMDRYRESLESALASEELKEYYRGHGGKVRHDNQGVYSASGASLPSWVTSVKRSRDV